MKTGPPASSWVQAGRGRFVTGGESQAAEAGVQDSGDGRHGVFGFEVDGNHGVASGAATSPPDVPLPPSEKAATPPSPQKAPALHRPPEKPTHFSGWDSERPPARRARGDEGLLFQARTGASKAQDTPSPGPASRSGACAENGVRPRVPAGLGKCPQDAAVPSCSLSDVGRSTLSAAALLTKGHSCRALSGTHDPWGDRMETMTCVACGVAGKVLTSCELPGTSGLRSFVRSAVHAMPFAQAVTLRKALASSRTARNALTVTAGVTAGSGQPAAVASGLPASRGVRPGGRLPPARWSLPPARRSVCLPRERRPGLCSHVSSTLNLGQVTI